MGDDLTSENFIMKIKAMSKPDRLRISAKKLIELIVDLPEHADDPRIHTLEARLNQLHDSMRHITTLATTNQGEINILKTENATLKRLNTDMQTDIEALKNANQDLRNDQDEAGMVANNDNAGTDRRP